MQPPEEEDHMRWSPLTVLALALLVAPPGVRGQNCALNPDGPNELTATVPGGSGTDFDFGWSGDYHDLQVPGGAQFDVCLSDCDTSTDPVCTVAGYAGGQSAVGRAFAPPIPIAIGTVPTCVVTKFAAPFATGTANVQTGEVDVTGGIAGDVYLTTLGAVCPECSGASAGAAGTCVGGASAGQPCTTDEVVFVENATGDQNYSVSRDCLPTGLHASVGFTVEVVTGTSMHSGLCAGQTDANACTGTCSAACTGMDMMGIHQMCCSDDTTQPCFPDTIERTGAPFPPAPAWPNPTYPKTGSGTLASAFCLPSGGVFGGLVDGPVGLPGPGAFILPVDVQFLRDTTAPPPPPECTADADCADADACTDDTCPDGSCVHTPQTGPGGTLCRLGGTDPGGICGDSIDGKTSNAIKRFIAKATKAVQAIPGAKAKKAKAKKRAAGKQIAMAIRKVKKAAKKKKGGLDSGCAGALQDALGALKQEIGAL
jgi:hypothetical protein